MLKNSYHNPRFSKIIFSSFLVIFLTSLGTVLLPQNAQAQADCWTIPQCKEIYEKAKRDNKGVKEFNEKSTNNFEFKESECGSGRGYCYAPKTPVKLNVPLGALEEVEDVSIYIRAAYVIGISLLGVFAVVYIMIGGVLWLTAAGRADQITKAKGYISNAVIGLLLGVSSFTILQTINPELVKLNIIKVKMLKTIYTGDFCNTLDADALIFLSGQKLPDNKDAKCGKEYILNEPTGDRKCFGNFCDANKLGKGQICGPNVVDPTGEITSYKCQNAKELCERGGDEPAECEDMGRVLRTVTSNRLTCYSQGDLLALGEDVVIGLATSVFSPLISLAGGGKDIYDYVEGHNVCVPGPSNIVNRKSQAEISKDAIAELGNIPDEDVVKQLEALYSEARAHRFSVQKTVQDFRIQRKTASAKRAAIGGADRMKIFVAKMEILTQRYDEIDRKALNKAEINAEIAFTKAQVELDAAKKIGLEASEKIVRAEEADDKAAVARLQIKLKEAAQNIVNLEQKVVPLKNEWLSLQNTNRAIMNYNTKKNSYVNVVKDHANKIEKLAGTFK